MREIIELKKKHKILSQNARAEEVKKGSNNMFSFLIHTQKIIISNDQLFPLMLVRYRGKIQEIRKQKGFPLISTKFLKK